MGDKIYFPVEDTNKVSDGYHTFGELYEHRIVLFKALCLAIKTPEIVPWKSRYHDDGSSYQSWFVAGVELPTGMITYHLPESEWDTFPVKILDRAPEYDGHTAKDVIQRLRDWMAENVP